MRAPRKTIRNARRLRRALSVPEARLWSCLRRREPDKPVFRRQHPIGPYVLDFYCAKARLAIELDGLSHDLGDRPQRDIRRDGWLKERGVTVIRIAASDLREIDQAADCNCAHGSRTVRPRVAKRSGGGGPRPCAVEGDRALARWRGRAAMRIICEVMPALMPRPLPPCFAWSPFPASRGRMKSGRARFSAPLRLW